MKKNLIIIVQWISVILLVGGFGLAGYGFGDFILSNSSIITARDFAQYRIGTPIVCAIIGIYFAAMVDSHLVAYKNRK